MPWKNLSRRKKCLVIALFLLLIIVGYFFIGWPKSHPDTRYGITWSKPYAEELGLNAEEGLRAALDEFGVKDIRIPAYWPEIERERGTYAFGWLESYMNFIGERGGKVALVVGSRLPRWPECWTPPWVGNLTQAERETAQLDYVRAVYEHFADHPALGSWQVENEASFTLFAHCPGLTRDLVRKELDYVRGEEAKRAEPRRVFTTDSGEISTWLAYAGHIDAKAVSVYRVVTNPTFGVFRYWFIPPWFYERKSWLVRPFVGPVFVAEFQMEPWANAPLFSLSPEEQFKTFDIDQMRKNFAFADHVGLSPVYFWGAEWWYWMKTKRNHPEFWEEAKGVFYARLTR